MSCTIERRSNGRHRDVDGTRPHHRRLLRLALAVLVTALAACVLLALAGHAPAQGTSAANITVPDDHSTIQAAVYAASMDDTILVRAGTYNGTVLVTKRLTIIGAGPDLTVLDGQGRSALQLLVSSIVVTGMRVTGATAGPGIVVHGSLCNVTHVLCTGNLVGIELHSTYFTMITNCTLAGNAEAGLALRASSDSNTLWNVSCDGNADGTGAIVEDGCDGNIFAGCSFDDQTVGIEIWGDYTMLLGCTARNNSAAGVYALSNSGLSVDGCAVSGSYGFYAGIHIESCLSVTVRLCNVSHNVGTRGGIAVWGSNDVLIEGCTLEGNSYSAVELYYGNGYVARDNLVANGNAVGIYLGGSGALVTGNEVVSNVYGIHIGYDASDNDVLGNNISKSFRSGIILSNGAHDNLVHNNSLAGNGLWGSPYNCAISLVGNSESGAYVQGNIVENNTFSDNTQTVSFHDALIRNNTFRYNTFEGGSSYVIDGGSHCGPNTFHHNHFVSGALLVGSPNAGDLFDMDGEGNYWHDYEQRYPNATAEGRVWDTAYRVWLGTAVYDRFPLAVPYDPHPPVARLGEDRRVPHGVEVALDANASSDDRGIEWYEWYIEDGTGNSRFGSPQPQFPWTFSALGRFSVQLTVWDAWGNQDSDTAIITVVDLTPPMAEAGPDIEVDMGSPFKLNGTASWDNVGISAIMWVIDPEGLDIVLWGFKPSATIDEPGDYAVMLYVSDAADQWANDSLVVHVLDAVRPVARAGPDIDVELGRSVTLDGSASTDNLGIVSWKWSYDTDGGSVLLEGERVVHEFSAPGVYVVTLQVTDAAGLWTSDVLTVRVHDRVPPVADAGPDVVVDQHALVTLDGSGSRDNVGIVLWTWTFDYNGSARELSGETVRFLFDEAGAYPVALRVEDAEGNWTTDTATVTVRDTTPPVADAGGDRTVDLGGELALDLGNSRDNVGIASFEWVLPEVAGVVPLGDNAFRFTALGTYLATLTVRDAAGNSASAAVAVRVVDREPPRAEAGADVTAIAGDEVVLDGSGSTDDAGIAGYIWRSDPAGLEATGQRVSWVPSGPGTYKVTLTVLDAALNRATDTITVTVLSRNFTLRLGPFLDADGAPVEGARVSLTLDGETREARTDANGWADLEVPRKGLPGTARVVVTKPGWRRLALDVPLDAEGRTDIDVPPMERGGEGLGGWVAPALLVALAAVVGGLMWRRARGPKDKGGG